MSGPRLVQWKDLDAAGRRDCLARAPLADDPGLQARARDIVARVRERGDAALIDYARQFDHVELERISVSEREFDEAEARLRPGSLAAIDVAIANVRRFHEAQRVASLRVETVPGVVCERVTRPIRAVGLYVPSGSAPLPSTAIMLGVPSLLAGCPVRVIATPPRADGRADPAVLAVARRCGIGQVFKTGGAQAIAALAYGTATVPKVDKIFGPGNAWVTAAKLHVAADPAGAAIDLPAGPSEVLVIADAQADPEFVAADLLAQAEHDRIAQAILVTPSAALATAVQREVLQQASSLPRREVVDAALAHARLIVVDGLDTAVDVSNAYAPEHLLLAVREPRALLPRITTAGSVFLGDWTSEALGDYCSGTNHVLPTYGHARAWSGLSLQDFERRMTVQEATPEGLHLMAATVIELAELEGLSAHADSVRRRVARLVKP